MGPNHSFGRFVKNMLRDSPKVSHIEHLLSSSSSLKNKEVLIHHGRGKIEKGKLLCLYPFFALVHWVIFKPCTYCRVFDIQLGDPFPLSHSIPLGLYPPTIGYLSHRHLRMLCPSLCQCCQVIYFVVHIGLKIICLESTIPSHVYPDSNIVPVSVLLFWSLYNIFLLFCVVDEGFIIALLWQVCPCRPQHIIQESDWETIQYLGTYMPQWWVSSFSTVGLNHWPLIRKFHECSTPTHLFTYRWNVLLYLEDHRHYWWFLSCLLMVYINDW